MRPLQRRTVNTRAADLTRRVESLERRIFEKGIPWILGSYTGGQQLATAGTTYLLGFDTASTNAPDVFTHIADTTTFATSTTAIDSSLVILQRGIYWFTAHITANPSAGDANEFQIRHTQVNAPYTPGTAASPFAQSWNTGGNDGIQALHNAVDQPGQIAWTTAILLDGTGSTFKPRAVKASHRIVGTTNTNIGPWVLLIVQISAIDGLETVSDNGIPVDWEDLGL